MLAGQKRRKNDLPTLTTRIPNLDSLPSGGDGQQMKTTVLKGAFNTDPGTKKEFMDNIKLQQDFAPR